MLVMPLVTSVTSREPVSLSWTRTDFLFRSIAVAVPRTKFTFELPRMSTSFFLGTLVSRVLVRYYRRSRTPAETP